MNTGTLLQAENPQFFCLCLQSSCATMLSQDFHYSAIHISYPHKDSISELLLPQVSLPQTSLCPPPSQEEGANEQALWRSPPDTVPGHGQVWSETGMMQHHLKHETGMSDTDCGHKPFPFRSLHTAVWIWGCRDQESTSVDGHSHVLHTVWTWFTLSLTKPMFLRGLEPDSLCPWISKQQKRYLELCIWSSFSANCVSLSSVLDQQPWLHTCLGQSTMLNL